MTSSVLSCLICRLARAEDKDQLIANFPDIYGGRDYLPAFYDHSTAYPERYKCFVAELNGEIVGFHMVQIVDGGTASIGMAGRVKSGFRGMGINRKLVREFESSFMERFYPGACSRMRVSSTAPELLSQRDDKWSRRLLGTLEEGILETTKVAIEKECGKPSPDTDGLLYSKDPDLNLKIITNPWMRQFYLSDFLCLHCEPYHVIDSQSDIMHYLSHPSVVLTYKLRRGNRQKVEPAHFAVSRIFSCPLGVNMVFETYGCDAEDIMEHLMFQINQRKVELLQTSTGNIVFTVYCVLSAPLHTFLERITQKHGWSITAVRQFIVGEIIKHFPTISGKL